MKQVFISYPRDNAAGQSTARALYSALQKQQISAFIDEESIEPGDRWLNSLKQGVADCQIMLSVVSAASHNRSWFEKEFNEVQKHDVLVIPVLAEDVEIPMQFTDLQAVPLYGEQAAEQQERLFQTIRKNLGVDLIKPLIDKARKAKRTEAYDAALILLQQVLDIDPHHAGAQQEVVTLQQLNESRRQGADLLQGLALRFTEVQPVFSQVADILNNAAKRPVLAVPLITQTALFLENKLSAQDYITISQSLCQSAPTPQKTAQSTDYNALAERICKGEIALFLGSDIAREYGHESFSEKQMAMDLAKQSKYDSFDGGLSSIAEYLRLHPGYGSSGLWDKLEGAVQERQSETGLYRLLARIDAPLVLISSGYDDQLECCFREEGKRFVELSSIVSRSDDYDIGHVIASYSDQKEPDRPYLAEELSALKLQDDGYSIIYKIRGSCTAVSKSELKRDALTVTESDYFTFARYAQKIIPSYLSSLLRGRGFLFVGFSPDSWEQRLLVDGLLSKRTHASDECYTVGVSQDPLEVAYWQKQKVQHYDVNLPELDEHIEEVLS